MNKGVEILLSRMESHPEEFDILHDSPLNSPWAWILEPLVRYIRDGETVTLNFLTTEEVDALFTRLMSIQADAFTHRIMRQLFAEHPEEIITPDYYTPLKRAGVA